VLGAVPGSASSWSAEPGGYPDTSIVSQSVIARAVARHTPTPAASGAVAIHDLGNEIKAEVCSVSIALARKQRLNFRKYLLLAQHLNIAVVFFHLVLLVGSRRLFTTLRFSSALLMTPAGAGDGMAGWGDPVAMGVALVGGLGITETA